MEWSTTTAQSKGKGKAKVKVVAANASSIKTTEDVAPVPIQHSRWPDESKLGYSWSN